MGGAPSWGGQRLITDNWELAGSLSSNCNLPTGVTFMRGGGGGARGGARAPISHFHEEEGDGLSPGLFTSGARRTSRKPLTTN